MALQKEGVILTAEGANRFIDVMESSSLAMQDLTDAMNAMSDPAANAGKAMGGVEKSGGALASVLGTIGPVAIGAAAALAGLVLGVGALGKAMAKLAAETAPLQGIMAQFAGITQEVEGGTQGMLSALQIASAGMISQRDLMTQYVNAAAMVNTEFAERMPEALRILGKVSAATGKDLNFMMQSVVQGVGKLSPMVIDNTTVQVKLAEATARASKELGKEAEALTVAETQAAIMSITLERLEENFGDLPDTSQTAAAQMARLGATFQNIKDTLGQFLLPAFAQFLEGINQLVGSFSMAISEGGAFYPVLINIGAALALLGDAFSGIASTVSEWLADMQTDTSDTFLDMIDNAFEWGVNIVTALADGITQAATTVLNIAMQAIENALSFWLGPGSPPKVAPKLREWGIDYMGELLGGMTEADWNILESIQAPLKKVLEGPAFAEISKSISESLAGGDRAGALDAIRKQTGAFGGELAELAQRQFDLVDATMAVTDAEKQLEAARKQQMASQQKVSAETAKYNELLREGASPEILGAQLKRINAAEQERDTATMASEEQLKLAQERKAEAESAAGLQKKVVDELLAYNDALTEQEKEERKAGKEKDKGASPIEAAIAGPRGGLDIAGRIGSAIDAAKGKLKEKFAELFAPLKKAWETNLAKLGEAWTTFTDGLGEVWTDIKTRWPGLQTLEDWVVDLPEKIKTMITEGWDKLKVALTPVWELLHDDLLPVLNDLKNLVIGAVTAKILDFAEAIWGKNGEGGLLAGLKKIWEWLDEKVVPILEEAFPTALELLRIQYVQPFTDGINSMKEALKLAHQWLGNLVEKLQSSNAKRARELWRGWLGKSPSPMAVGISTAADAMERMASVSLPKLQMAMTGPRGAGAMGGSTFRPAGNVTNNSNSFNFNTTNNAAIDAVAFEASVLRVVRRAIGGAT